MGSTTRSDVWAQVEDLDGQLLYRVLDLQPRASQKDVKQAYRRLAKAHHPDKPGGSAARFAKVQDAFATLADPKKRLVYDTWARELRFRYIDAHRAAGGEDVLLNSLAESGLQCDPFTQLVVTCEVCRRPATKECWTCGMQICEFCTLKRHWKGDFPLHWPLINSDHMRTKLAKQELQKKKLEDAHRLALENPNYRTEAELQEIRAFKEASCRMLGRKDCLVAYELALVRYYMWAQTKAHVYIAIHVPTGYADKEIMLDCTDMGMKLQPESSPPLIHRAFDYSIDLSSPIDTFRTQDNRVMTVQLPKAKVGQHWHRLFRGDPDGARCLQPPYQLSESDDSLLMELELPLWTEADDVITDIQPLSVEVRIRGGPCLHRTCWKSRETGGEARAAIDPADSLWALDSDQDAAGDPVRVLALHLAKTPVSESEITWKKGVRQDNRVQPRPGRPHQKGMRFFADDEDIFDLEDLLQALCIMEEGRTWVPSKPWEHGSSSRWETDPDLLSPAVKAHLERLLDEAERADGPCRNEA